MSQKVPQQDSLLGQIVSGQYRLDQVLGQGGMGTVYRATQLSVGRSVAVKLINGDALTNEQVLKRFAREAQALSRLTHPNTVRLFDYGVTERQQPFMVMELLQGNDVAEEIERRGPIELRRALTITLQVLRALQEAHALGVVHRDLKPSNIFLTKIEGSDVFAKVLDFGIAGFDQVSEAQKLTVTGIVMGSAAYMSPEQAQGLAVGATSDLYSVGAVLFEMLTGLPPFKAETMVSMLVAHITQQPPRLETARPELPAPPAVQALLDELMAKNPGERPQSARAVAERIDALLAGALSGPFERANPQPGAVVQQHNVPPQRPDREAGDSGPQRAQGKGTYDNSQSGLGSGATPAVSWPGAPQRQSSHRTLYAALSAVGCIAIGAAVWAFTAGGSGAEASETPPVPTAASAAVGDPAPVVAAEPVKSEEPRPEEPKLASAASVAPAPNAPALAGDSPAGGQPKATGGAPRSPSPLGAQASTPSPAKSGATAGATPIVTQPLAVRTPPVASSAPVKPPAPTLDPALSSPDRAVRRQALLRAPRYTNVASAKAALASGALTREGYEDAIWVLKNLREVSLRAAKADYKSRKIDKETYRARVDEIEGRYRGL